MKYPDPALPGMEAFVPGGVEQMYYVINAESWHTGVYAPLVAGITKNAQQRRKFYQPRWLMAVTFRVQRGTEREFKARNKPYLAEVPDDVKPPAFVTECWDWQEPVIYRALGLIDRLAINQDWKIPFNRERFEEYAWTMNQMYRNGGEWAAWADDDE